MRVTLRDQLANTPDKPKASLRRHLAAAAVAMSNAIEGFKVSIVDAEDLLTGENDVHVSEENRQETLDTARSSSPTPTIHASPHTPHPRPMSSPN